MSHSRLPETPRTAAAEGGGGVGGGTAMGCTAEEGKQDRWSKEQEVNANQCRCFKFCFCWIVFCVEFDSVLSSLSVNPTNHMKGLGFGRCSCLPSRFNLLTSWPLSFALNCNNLLPGEQDRYWYPKNSTFRSTTELTVLHSMTCSFVSISTSNTIRKTSSLWSSGVNNSSKID